MPIIKSAKKRVKVSEKAAIRNSKTKRTLKTAIKSFRKAVTSASKKNTEDTRSKAESALDTAAKKGLLHKNKVARQKKQLAAAAKKVAGVKPVATKKPAVKKAPAKKPAVAKAPVAKKPAVKKAVAKKPATKK